MSTPVVQRGTLEVVEIVNGYALYGKGPNRDMGNLYPDIFLGHLGDEAMPEGYDPNEDHDLPDAYGFKVV